MVDLYLNYVDFKPLAITKALQVQYVDVNGVYYIFAFDSSFSIQCNINQIADPADAADFVSVFMPTANERIENLISVTSMPLPSGAATETTVASLNSKVTAINTGAVTISSALPAGSNSIGTLGANSGTDIGDVTINNAVGAAAVNIQDGGNSITVDATNLDVALSTRLKPADTLAAVTTVGTITNPVASTQSGTWTVQPGNTANTTAWKVDGSAVTQPISGTITANAGSNLNTSALALDATLTGGTQKSIARGGAKGSTVAADITSTASGADHQLIDIAIYDASGNQITSFGGGTQYADGAARGSATGTLAMGDDGTNIQSVSVDSTGKLNINNISGTVTLPTGAATESTLGDVKTSVQLIDDGIGTVGSASTTKGMAALGHDGTNARILKTDASGELQVDVLTLPSIPAGSNNIGDVDVLTLPALAAGTALIGKVGIDQTTPGTTNKVSIGTDGTVVLGAGTAGIGKLTANAGVTIGAVEIAASQTLSTVTTVGTITNPVNAVFNSGTKATYSVGTSCAPGTSPDDVLVFVGSATKTIRITKIYITAYATAIAGIPTSRGNMRIDLKKWSSAFTGGTSVTTVIPSRDSANAAATAVINRYTVNPTPAGAVGTLMTQSMLVPAFGATDAPQIPILWQFGDNAAQPIVLRGTSESVSLNLASNPSWQGCLMWISIEWTEE